MLRADRQGFLIGETLGSDAGLRILTSIKGDTGKILSAMRGRAGAEPSRRAVTPAVRAAAASVAPAVAAAVAAATSTSALRRAAVVPAARQVFAPRLRDAGGRFLSGAASGADGLAAAATPELRTLARATQAIAITQEQARRDGRGRFQAGQGGGAGSGSDGRSSSAGGPMGNALRGAGAGIGNALNGSDRVDPALAAASELKALAGGALGVVTPAARAVMGDGRAAAGDVGWLRRMWAELRATRAGGEKNNRELLKAVKDNKPGSSDSSGGLLGLLPMLAARVFPTLAAIVAPLSIGAAVVALAKRFPALGAIFSLMEGSSAADAINADTSLTPQQRAQALAANTGRTAGTIGGMVAGAAAGTAILPGVGTLVGAGIGAYAGRKGGSALGSAAARWGAVKDDIGASAAANGVDPNLVASIAGLESRFDPTAQPRRRNGTLMSSAHGLGQFIDSTWIDTVRKHGERNGVAGAAGMSSAAILALRNDPALQAKMLAAHTADNVALGRKIGGPDDGANAYALHNLGGGDGRKFLSAMRGNPSAAVSSVLSAQVIANNPSIYGNGSGTVGQAYATMQKKLAEGGALAQRGIPSALAMTATPGLPKMAPMAPLPSTAAPQIPPMPTIEAPGPQRLNSAPTVVAAAPPAPVSQDVSDRSIAHIATGGISGTMVARR